MDAVHNTKQENSNKARDLKTQIYEDALHNTKKENLNKARNLMAQAYEAEKQKKYDEAAQLIYEALDLNDLQAPWYSAYGRSLEKLERFDEALVSYEKAVSLTEEPTNPSFLYLASGRCLEKLERFDEALVSYEKAMNLTDEPNPSFLYLASGRCLEKLERFDEALVSYEKAVSLTEEPTNPSFLYLASGRCLEKLERFDEALVSYEKAVNLTEESNPSLLRILGLCALRLGEERKAYEALRLAVAVGLKSSKIDAILADLEQKLNSRGKRTERTTAEMFPIYYDHVYSASQENEHHDFDIYFGLWEKIAEKIAQNQCRILLDLGCGPGIFARFLLSKLPHLVYTGIDFSPVAIQQAQQHCPESTFIETDAFKTSLLTEGSFEMIVSTEFLEHVEHDLELLQRIKPNTLFYGSVPNYYAFGHVRYFKTTAEVYDRYAPYIKNLSVEDVPIGEGRILYFLSGAL